ncbi:MAG TPA: ABC transporter permease [Paracoccaceae bacterium]|nr:ABC transporter permease [Paracoccaceae bacterium]
MSAFWARFSRNRGAVIGILILAAVIAVALLAPFLFPRSPWSMVQRPFLPPLSVEGLPFGTDTMGRDVAAGLAHGARVSLLVGLASTLVSLLIGVPIGALAGYFGGWVDDALMRLTELFQSVPSFALAIVLVAIFQPHIVSIVIAIAVVSWPPVARLLRGEVMALRSREFVEAAVLSGQTSRTIILRQILPNTLSPIVVMGSMMVAAAILIEGALAFMGLGDPNIMSWGYMIGAARTVIRQAWWLSFFPGVAILLTVLALNLIGEGLNDALNPRLARRTVRPA